MNIDEIKKMKSETENQIRDLLIRFSETTGLVVEGVSFEMLNRSSHGGSGKIGCTSVEMDVRLG